jgi:formylglycine-generating enzyme required for sulfatase activity
MALVGAVCVDRWEATLVGWSPYEVPVGSQVAQSVEGVPPQGYISGEMAAAACEAAGKRLCTLEEWMRACQGPDGLTWPYGNTYDPAACNDTCGQHPVLSYWGDDPNAWDSEHMNAPGINQQPDTLAPTGSFPTCVSAEGIYDLHGNLHEWIADPDGTFKGGFYVDGSINGQGCNYTTTAHTFDYHDYSTGFRCCAEMR